MIAPATMLTKSIVCAWLRYALYARRGLHCAAMRRVVSCRVALLLPLGPHWMYAVAVAVAVAFAVAVAIDVAFAVAVAVASAVAAGIAIVLQVAAAVAVGVPSVVGVAVAVAVDAAIAALPLRCFVVVRMVAK